MHLGSIGTGTLSHESLRSLVGADPNGRTRISESGREWAFKESREVFVWALKDITFHWEEGEVLGIIGKNGARESPLCWKSFRGWLLCRVASVHGGRIASLLEVGTGFHPEMTGQGRIFIWMVPSWDDQGGDYPQVDEIVAFAGVEKYIDTQWNVILRVWPCGWDLLSPPIWSRKFWWWTRCWQWAMRNSKEGYWQDAGCIERRGTDSLVCQS